MGRAGIAEMTTSTMLVVATTMLFMSVMLHGGVSAQEAPAPAPGVQEAPAPAPGVQETPAPGPGTTDCLTILLGLSDCLTYVEEGSNLTKPDKPCCPELAGLVNDHPVCLCYLLANSSNSLGIQIDRNKALKLPTVCKVDTPPPSSCSLLGIPVAAPTASEAAPPANSPGSAVAPEAASSSPATNTDKNGASRTAHSVMAFLAALVIAFLPIFI